MDHLVSYGHDLAATAGVGRQAPPSSGPVGEALQERGVAADYQHVLC